MFLHQAREQSHGFRFVYAGGGADRHALCPLQQRQTAIAIPERTHRAFILDVHAGAVRHQQFEGALELIRREEAERSHHRRESASRAREAAQN